MFWVIQKRIGEICTCYMLQHLVALLCVFVWSTGSWWSSYCSQYFHNRPRVCEITPTMHLQLTGAEWAGQKFHKLTSDKGGILWQGTFKVTGWPILLPVFVYGAAMHSVAETPSVQNFFLIYFHVFPNTFSCLIKLVLRSVYILGVPKDETWQPITSIN